MEALARQILQRWPFIVADVRLAAQRENAVFRVTAGDGQVLALRLHRPGYRSIAELQSELQWMAAVAEGGVSIPQPMASRLGKLVETAGGHDADLLTWLPGQPMGKTGMPLGLPDAPQVFFALGREMARLHDVSDAWMPPAGFARHAWDIEGLVGEAPLWGRFWENPGLSGQQRRLITAAREKASIMLSSLASGLDYGLIHADLVRENVLIDGRQLHFIDFDDGGFGFRLFDVATALLKNRNEPDYVALKTGLITGYRSVRPLDTAYLPLFLMLRAFTYLGWIVPRMDEAGSEARNARFIAESTGLAEAWLG